MVAVFWTLVGRYVTITFRVVYHSFCKAVGLGYVLMKCTYPIQPVPIDSSCIIVTVPTEEQLYNAGTQRTVILGTNVHATENGT